jgi:hypothetical protein
VEASHLIEMEESFSGRTLILTIFPERDSLKTLADFLNYYRKAEGKKLEQSACIPKGSALSFERFKDTLFLLDPQGRLGEVDPELLFELHQEQVEDLAETLPFHSVPQEGEGSTVFWCHLWVDTSYCHYKRPWNLYFKRRWSLQAELYENFVSETLKEAYGNEALRIHRCQTAGDKELFLKALAEAIYNAPYETYSRYLPAYPPFKSADEALEAIIKGDGGVCSEKVMAMYFLAQHYGISTEIVLGGEDARGTFPAGELRDLLDQAQFDFHFTTRIQKFWEHFALIFHLGASQSLFCDLTHSNIPFIWLSLEDAKPYLLEGGSKKPLKIRMTLQESDLYYHRIAAHQDIAFDLYFAMEHFIDFMDLIHTIDTELGLVLTPHFWIGVIVYTSEKTRQEVLKQYQEELTYQLQSSQDLCFASDLLHSTQALVLEFRQTEPLCFNKMVEAGSYLEERLEKSYQDADVTFEYVFLKRYPSPSELESLDDSQAPSSNPYNPYNPYG